MVINAIIVCYVRNIKIIITHRNIIRILMSRVIAVALLTKEALIYDLKMVLCVATAGQSVFRVSLSFCVELIFRL